MRLTKLYLDRKDLGMFSPLEKDVLDILWRTNSDMRVREIYSLLRRKRRIALTSVAVILDRLHQKKIVSRQVETGIGGEHYIYAAMPKTQFQEAVVENTIDKLIDTFGPVAVSYFNEKFRRRR